MKSHTQYFTFHTKKRRELVHLTPKLADVLARSGIVEGFMLVSAMHITAGVFVNMEPLAGVTIGVLLFGDILTLPIVFGGVLIIAGSFAVVLSERGVQRADLAKSPVTRA